MINRVKRKGKGYDVHQIHNVHAKLALSDDDFQLLMKLLKSSSNVEIKENRGAWIQSMHQGMGKGSETCPKLKASKDYLN